MNMSKSGGLLLINFGGAAAGADREVSERVTTRQHPRLTVLVNCFAFSGLPNRNHQGSSAFRGVSPFEVPK
jgi:hypothetical protein